MWKGLLCNIVSKLILSKEILDFLVLHISGAVTSYIVDVVRVRREFYLKSFKHGIRMVVGALTHMLTYLAGSYVILIILILIVLLLRGILGKPHPAHAARNSVPHRIGCS